MVAVIVVIEMIEIIKSMLKIYSHCSDKNIFPFFSPPKLTRFNEVI